MKVLSDNQMQKLKELGIDTSKASIRVGKMIFTQSDPWYGKEEHDVYLFDHEDNYTNCFVEEYRAFTSQDIIELLPHNIYDGLNKKYSLVIQVNIVNCFIIHYLSFGKSIDELIHFYDYDIIDAVYKMLVWVTEKGYLETK